MTAPCNIVFVLFLSLFLPPAARLLLEVQIRGSIVVSISACHAEDPGSIPGRGVFAQFLFFVIMRRRGNVFSGASCSTKCKSAFAFLQAATHRPVSCWKVRVLHLARVSCGRVFERRLHASALAPGYIAQWLERLTADQQVPGSNPGVPSLLR